MLDYEYYFYRQGKKRIAGIDEVGRGSLAGPVVACAVVLPGGFTLKGITDSKKLTHTKRVTLCNQLLKYPDIEIGLGIVSYRIIDKINILQATKVAMHEAVMNLPHPPDHLLIDGMFLNSIHLSQTKIIKGDSRSLSIASASIIAKIVRDSITDTYNDVEPFYGFIRHKGYGTKEHLDALQLHGVGNIHRQSFALVKKCFQEVAV